MVCGLYHRNAVVITAYVFTDTLIKSSIQRRKNLQLVYVKQLFFTAFDRMEIEVKQQEKVCTQLYISQLTTCNTQM